ncbi:MAG: hypothetical protein RR090_09130 [Niameybacter sp.]|uniref:hypothetical protein n=1 Tax=Niameybacter sp. TaxID=2033640 RepID=UPI002FCAF561
MDKENIKPIQQQETESITYDEAFTKLRAFIQKTRQEEHAQQEAEKGEQPHA